MFDNVDLQEELRREKNRERGNALVSAINELLSNEAEIEDRLVHGIRSTGPVNDTIIEDRCDPSNLFNNATIQHIATKYRLRFLPSHYFTGTIPHEAICKLKALQQKQGKSQLDLWILAPARNFRLGDSDGDPLLFAKTDRGLFYLIHQWGNDLAWYRSWAFWPLRTLYHLILTIVLVIGAITLIVPNSWITMDPGASYLSLYRIIFFVWALLVSGSFVVFAWFAFFGKFNAQAWNDKCFN